MKSVCLINVFFGEFPWYLDFFLKSCENNDSISFFIFSDNPLPMGRSKNVFHKPFTLEQFNSLASEKLDFEISVKRNYKLCDFKPAFGLIFEDYINGFDFWGFCDLDLIFGNIRSFITSDLLDKYQIISARHDYPTGFFMLFDNSFELKVLFKCSKDYKKVFTSSRNFCFDECNYKYDYVTAPEDILKIDCEIESMLEVIVKASQKGSVKVYFEFMVVEGFPGKLFWNHGNLFFDDKYEILLYHFVGFKANIYTKIPKFKKIPDSFYISRHTIHLWKYNPTMYLFNYIIPLIKRRLLILNRVFSILINVPKYNVLPDGIYTYGETKLEVSCNRVKNLTDKSTPDLIELKLIRSVFNENKFFIENRPCTYIFNPNSKAKGFIEIRNDGFISNYKLE